MIFHEGFYPFAENKSRACREAQNCERLGNIYVEDDFENLLNSHHSQPDLTILIENFGDEAHGSPLRRDQFDCGPGPGHASNQPAAQTGPNLTTADDGPDNGAHRGAEHKPGPTANMGQPSRGSGLSTVTGTNGPSPSNGPPEIGPTASVDRGSKNGPVAQLREK